MHKNNNPILLKNIRVIDASQNLDQEMNITVNNGIISYFDNSKKNFPFNILKKFSKENKHLLIGIINPSDKNDGLKCIKLADFAIVGSVEEKAYYSKYIKCFIYPLIEEVDEKYIKEIIYFQELLKSI